MVRRRSIGRGGGESLAGGAGDEQGGGNAVFHAEFLEDSFHVLFDRAPVGLQDDGNLRIRFPTGNPMPDLGFAWSQAVSSQRLGARGLSRRGQHCIALRLVEMRAQEVQHQPIALGEIFAASAEAKGGSSPTACHGQTDVAIEFQDLAYRLP